MQYTSIYIHKISKRLMPQQLSVSKSLAPNFFLIGCKKQNKKKKKTTKRVNHFVRSSGKEVDTPLYCTPLALNL